MAVFRSSPETFTVHEVPAYEPSGDGAHAYVFVEKRGLTTPDAIRLLAEAVGVNPRDVGYAGMKDKHAVTRQWLSFPETAQTALAALDGAVLAARGLGIVSLSRHNNKLRIGHVRKNVFEVTLEQVDDGEAETLSRTYQRLAQEGVPNRYGQQRFGVTDNVAEGLALLRRQKRQPDRRKRTFLMSAVQSAVFNHVLDERVAQKLLTQVLAGDVLQKRPTGGLFTSTDAPTDQARLDAGELVITGPLPGVKAPRPSAGSPAEALESAAMAAVGLTEELVQANARDLPGARRPLVMNVESLAPPAFRDGRMVLNFALPAGAYATVVVEALLGRRGDPDLPEGPPT
ncbi:MAG: tRNA pseudouridine(13) synthase TruD [Myxococcales bacterium]|nr:tRNA pseudouridine(13) synthase TruD [Myxococcales bacterium]